MSSTAFPVIADRWAAIIPTSIIALFAILGIEAVVLSKDLPKAEMTAHAASATGAVPAKRIGMDQQSLASLAVLESRSDRLATMSSAMWQTTHGCPLVLIPDDRGCR